MHKSIRLLIGGSVLVLSTCFFITVSAQMDDFDSTPTDEQSPGDGPVGTTDDQSDGDTDTTPTGLEWKDLSGYVGPLGRVDEYLPHEACDGCFTLPHYDTYAIYEYVKADVDDGAIIIPRDIPNPAPSVTEHEDYDATIRGYIDPDTDERVWYVGTQEFVGPTDEEKWSPDLPFSTIKMKRIQARHLDTILGIPGVVSFGIGTRGFVVALQSAYRETSLTKIPETLEGVPVDVDLTDAVVTSANTTQTLATTRLRPIPAGVSLSVGSSTNSGTLGPHAVRDTDTASNGTCCEMLSLTAGHVANPWNASPTRWDNQPAYSPATPHRKKPKATDRIGAVDFVFARTYCGKVRLDPTLPLSNPARWIIPLECRRSNNLTNHTHERPDVGLISYGWRSVPFNNPERADPIRRMQYGTSKSVRGPSGRVKLPKKNDKHKIWGSRTPANSTGKVTIINDCVRVYPTPDAQRQAGDPITRYCGVNIMERYRTQPGDSGALVAYKGEGHHYIAGVFFASRVWPDGLRVDSVYTPATHILKALKTAKHPISHFWGTHADHQNPSTNDGDD